jgi:hypothetical protein
MFNVCEMKVGWNSCKLDKGVYIINVPITNVLLPSTHQSLDPFLHSVFGSLIKCW